MHNYNVWVKLSTFGVLNHESRQNKMMSLEPIYASDFGVCRTYNFIMEIWKCQNPSYQYVYCLDIIEKYLFWWYLIDTVAKRSSITSSR
jgi:hypothetical protein